VVSQVLKWSRGHGDSSRSPETLLANRLMPLLKIKVPHNPDATKEVALKNPQTNSLI